MNNYQRILSIGIFALLLSFEGISQSPPKTKKTVGADTSITPSIQVSQTCLCTFP